MRLPHPQPEQVHTASFSMMPCPRWLLGGQHMAIAGNGVHVPMPSLQADEFGDGGDLNPAFLGLSPLATME